MIQYEKIIFCIIPRPLYDRRDNDNWRQIGWVWMQRALLSRTLNIALGWVAFSDLQTKESMAVCTTCKKRIKEQ